MNYRRYIIINFLIKFLKDLSNFKQNTFYRGTTKLSNNKIYELYVNV